MANTEQLVGELKAWITEQSDVPDTPDELLKCFLQCTENNIEQAKKTIHSYYSMKASGPELFQDRDVDNESMQNILSVFHTFMCPKPSPEGYKILISHLVNTDTKKYDMVAQMKYMIMTLECSLVDEPISPGHIIIFDISNLSPGHVLKFSPSGIKKTSNYLQEAIPLHIHAVYLVNASAVVDIMMKAVKPFLNMDLFKRTFIYKSADMDKLYDKVPKDCLPEEYGGLLPACSVINEKNTEKLRKLKTYFQKEDSILKLLG